MPAHPKILSHISSLNDGNFASPEFILNKKNNTEINLFRRFCPHRMYPLADTGTQLQGHITCKFHNFEWDENGSPINNNKRLNCGSASIGRSGLIYKDFIEPNHFWVDDLANEDNLKYSHSVTGSSIGSWLWMMEIQADLLHVWKGGIHPQLSEITNLDDIGMYEGEGWALQTCSTGWWLCIYPYTFIEWSKGCLAINYAVPKTNNDEFGFEWISQFFYDDTTQPERRKNFEKYFQDVFVEDVIAIEKQKGKYFPLTQSQNKLENHCVHFGKWVKQHLIKN